MSEKKAKAARREERADILAQTNMARCVAIGNFISFYRTQLPKEMGEDIGDVMEQFVEDLLRITGEFQGDFMAAAGLREKETKE